MNEPVGRYVLSASLRDRQKQFRDQLYSLALLYGGVIANLCDTCEKEAASFGLEGRLLDNYCPIIAIAMFLDAHSSSLQ